MARFLLLLLVIPTINLFAGKPLTWYEGAVVLADQQVLTGQVAVHPRQNIIMFRSGDQQTVYPAHKIQNVFYYDEQFNINRKFVSIANRDHGYAKYELYEIVLRGEVSVLRKERIHLDLNDQLDFNYFVMYQDEVLPIKQFNKRVYPHLIDCDSFTFSRFIEREHLNPNSLRDAISMIKYYNRMVSHSSSLARG
ncbi:MAG TPA: hypothetical protein VFW11_21670 [Cyclobacteriaceae bacterium]|nr:hypothetical protein [Cyclobacteriaceae bacterium]